MSVSAIDKGPLCSMLAGIQARLQLAFPPAMFCFEIMPAKLTPSSWTRTVKRTPFVGLGWNSAESKSGTSFAGVAHFSVFVVVQNTNGERARLLGDSQGSGLFAVVQAALLVLNGFKVPDLANPPTLPGTLGGTVGTCIARVASNAAAEWADDNLAVAVIDIEVQGLALTIARNLQGAEATPDLWNEIATSWVFPGSGAEAQVSDDSTVGAST